jgi:hypothetical protein
VGNIRAQPPSQPKVSACETSLMGLLCSC